MPVANRARKDDEVGMWNRRQQVAELYLQGKSQYQIAELVGCSQPTVSNDLAWLQEYWLAHAATDFDKARALELAKLNNLEMELWAAWKKSQETQVAVSKKRKWIPEVKTNKRTGETTRTGKMIPVETTQDRKTIVQVGDPAYTAQILQICTLRIKLLGLIKEDKEGGKLVIVNWHQLADPDAPADTLEARIAAIDNIETVAVEPPPPGTPSGTDAEIKPEEVEVEENVDDYPEDQ